MNEQLLYQLLKIIQHNGNIWDIIGEGYEFGQITYLLDILKERIYLSTDENGKTAVTDSGKAYILGYEANEKIPQYSRWVLSQSNMWYAPMKETEIYIPKE